MCHIVLEKDEACGGSDVNIGVCNLSKVRGCLPEKVILLQRYEGVQGEGHVIFLEKMTLIRENIKFRSLGVFEE